MTKLVCSIICLVSICVLFTSAVISIFSGLCLDIRYVIDFVLDLWVGSDTLFGFCIVVGN